MNAFGKLLTQFYWARAGLARAVNLSAAPPNEAAETLRRDGVVVLPAALPPAALEAVADVNRRFFDPARAAEQAYSPDGKKLLEAADASPAELARYYFLHIKNYHRKLDVYELIDPVVAPILSAYYRSKYYYRDFECYRTQAPSAQDEYAGSFSWHRDNYPPGTLKVIVYMTDVLAPEAGPLVYAPGSHAGFRPELGHYGPRIPAEEVEGKLRLLPCLGPRGSVVVFDNNGVHRASRPSTGTREVLNANVFPRVGLGRPAPTGFDPKEEAGFLKKYTR